MGGASGNTGNSYTFQLGCDERLYIKDLTGMVMAKVHIVRSVWPTRIEIERAPGFDVLISGLALDTDPLNPEKGYQPHILTHKKGGACCH